MYCSVLLVDYKLVCKSKTFIIIYLCIYTKSFLSKCNSGCFIIHQLGTVVQVKHICKVRMTIISQYFINCF